MAILTDDSIIELTDQLAGESKTIRTGDLKELISKVPIILRYEGSNVRTLEPGNTWQTGTITISIDVNFT